jgi:type II secretory pathway pseudopilin PulG
MSFHELLADYPWLVKRVARMAARAQGQAPALPSRNPLAYLFALPVPRTGMGAAGGGMVSLLMMVAVIGIIAAIAIPSLLRARVSANESAAVGDLRTVVSAQAAYASLAGSYGSLDCLAKPSSSGCLTGYPPTGPTFLDASIAGMAVRNGYRRSFVAGERAPTDGNPYGLAEFCYSAVPAVRGQTGVRSFAADHTGVVCYDPEGADLCRGSSLPFDCAPLQ